MSSDLKARRPVISKRQAMQILPMCDRESRDFLVQEELVHRVRGREMVVLVDLEAAVRRYDAAGANEVPPVSTPECG